MLCPERALEPGAGALVGSKGCGRAPCLLQEQSDGVVETRGRGCRSRQACLYPKGIRESQEVMSVRTLVNVKDLGDHLRGHRSPLLPSFHGDRIGSSVGLWKAAPYTSLLSAQLGQGGLSHRPDASRANPTLPWGPPGDRRSLVPAQESEHLGLQVVTVPQMVGGWEGRGRALRTFFKFWIQLLPRPVLFLNFY